MQENDVYWNILSHIADILGVIAAVISLLTYLATRKIRKAIVSHDEIKHYREEINEILSKLISLHSSMKEDNLYNEKILTQVAEELTAIRIQYSSVVKGFSKDINKLEVMIYNICIPGLSSNSNRKVCIRKFGEIIERLKKEEAVS